MKLDCHKTDLLKQVFFMKKFKNLHENFGTFFGFVYHGFIYFPFSNVLLCIIIFSLNILSCIISFLQMTFSPTFNTTFMFVYLFCQFKKKSCLYYATFKISKIIYEFMQKLSYYQSGNVKSYQALIFVMQEIMHYFLSLLLDYLVY